MNFKRIAAVGVSTGILSIGLATGSGLANADIEKVEIENSIESENCLVLKDNLFTSEQFDGEKSNYVRGIDTTCGPFQYTQKDVVPGTDESAPIFKKNYVYNFKAGEFVIQESKESTEKETDTKNTEKDTVANDSVTTESLDLVPGVPVIVSYSESEKSPVSSLTEAFTKGLKSSPLSWPGKIYSGVRNYFF